MNTYQAKLTNTNQTICLSPATQQDIMSVSKILKWNWQNHWSSLGSNCEAIIKLESQGSIQGLIKIILQPYRPNGKPEYLEIAAIEATRSPHRSVEPVGFYLMWYATKTSISRDCTGNEDEDIVVLDSLIPAVGYYKDKIGMEYKGKCVTLAPGEEAYTFGFSKEQAIKFCNRIEQQYGISQQI